MSAFFLASEMRSFHDLGAVSALSEPELNPRAGSSKSKRFPV